MSKLPNEDVFHGHQARETNAILSKMNSAAYSAYAKDVGAKNVPKVFATSKFANYS